MPTLECNFPKARFNLRCRYGPMPTLTKKGTAHAIHIGALSEITRLNLLRRCLPPDAGSSPNSSPSSISSSVFPQKTHELRGAAEKRTFLANRASSITPGPPSNFGLGHPNQKSADHFAVERVGNLIIYHSSRILSRLASSRRRSLYLSLSLSLSGPCLPRRVVATRVG